MILMTYCFIRANIDNNGWHYPIGSDDKAGIAEIISAMEYLIDHHEIKHGPIRIGFTHDEEIGRGAHKFDVEKFGAAWAYTMDGSQIENWNMKISTLPVPLSRSREKLSTRAMPRGKW